MATAGKPDADLFRPGDYFTGFVILRLREELAALRCKDLLDDVARSAAPQLTDVLTRYGVKRARRLVTAIDLDGLLELERRAADGSLPPLHSLAAYWRIEVPQGSDDLRAVVETLAKLPEVDDAYLDIHVVPAAVNPADDPRSTSQGYLRSAPDGIDAQWAWAQANGDGTGVGFADVEEGWNVNHEDLAAGAPTLVAGVNRSVSLGSPPYAAWLILSNADLPAWNHGTGALGVVAARDNAVGIVGIAPGTGPIRLASVWDGSTPGHVVNALVTLVTFLSAGDVVMLELQTARGNITGWPDNHPIEIKDAERDAIRLAVSAHNLIVVAAAGNGGVDLDAYVSPQGSSAGKQVLNRSSADFQDSGSILVGSATSTVPHSRMNTSNFGSRVDCYGWGENVATCGMPLFPDLNTDANRWYRTDYNGTSAATPIVGGAATLLQGMYKASTGIPLSGLQMRALLSDPTYGTSPAPSTAVAKIGVMPDLRKLSVGLALTPDIFLRDTLGDDGAVPSLGPLASSPDIVVRDAASADPQVEFGEGSANENRDDLDSIIVGGSNATIYLRCLNRGGSDAVDVVGRAWWSPPATLVTPDLWTPIGQTAPFTLTADRSLTVSPPINWANVPQGHVCLVAAIGCARDPAPPQPGGYNDWQGFEDLIRKWNNITWRNINVVPVSGGELTPLPFRIVGAPKDAQLFDFELDLSLTRGTLIGLEVPGVIGKGLRRRVDLQPVRRQSDDFSAFRFPLRPVIHLCDVMVPPGSANEARLVVRLPEAKGPVNGRVVLKQKLAGLEVGRITWRLVDRRRDAKGSRVARSATD